VAGANLLRATRRPKRLTLKQQVESYGFDVSGLALKLKLETARLSGGL